MRASPAPAAEVTDLLDAWSDGDAAALERLETAEVLAVPSDTVLRDWRAAKAFLRRELEAG